MRVCYLYGLFVIPVPIQRAHLLDDAILDVCFINSSPVELPYACTVEGDRRQVQNVGAGG